MSADSPSRSFLPKHRLTPNAIVVAGSSLLWAWGLICYLSPALFPGKGGTQSVGLEAGFFVSQAFVIVVACLLLALPPLRRLAVRRFTLGACAVASSVLTLALAAFVAQGCTAGIVACGVVHGVCVPLLGAAWGARYSIGSKGMQSLIVLSFLIAYALYFIVAFFPYPLGAACVAAMPLASWMLWRADARGREILRCEPDGSLDGAHQKAGLVLLGELIDGSWEPSGMPWRALTAVLLAAFAGNMVASAAMGFSYENADGLFKGGAFVCACIATMALVPLTSRGSSLSASAVYRITLTFTAAGLVGLLASDVSAVSLCGALVQGCAFFFQVLVIVCVSRATWEKALSPLLSFCLAQAVTAAVVLFGNIAGKQISIGESACHGLFEWACAAAMLVLFLVMTKQAADADSCRKTSSARCDGCADRPQGQGCVLEPCDSRESAEAAPAGESGCLDEKKAALFAAAFGLTKRESEVFEYLSKGRSLPYIADELFVTTGTVKTHTAHIYRKLRVNSKQELLDMFEAWKAS